uniref:RIN4 pathogenic type III effector avirulence factor Avr cleavage site domain-containing protein n=3 Tax=Triticinae TaxID=1648030 RepID=A0A453MI16_AEGTS
SDAIMVKQQHQGVPKFGNWEDEGQGYTQYFENARMGKSPGRPVNQNDRNEGAAQAPSNDPPSVKASPLRPGSEPGLRKNRDERRATREDLRRHEAAARKTHAESPNHRYGDQTNYDGAARKASNERSPIHPRQQARLADKGGVSSPIADRRGSAPTTPGRSKMRPTGRGDETPERGSAVPKFGDWDEKDPSTGEGFTDIFEKVREEKQSGADTVGTSHAYKDRYNQGDRYESSGCSCFSWFKK